MFHWLEVTSPSKHSLHMSDLLAVVPLLPIVFQFPFTLGLESRLHWPIPCEQLVSPMQDVGETNFGQELSMMTPASTQTSNLRDILINNLQPACMIKLTTTFDISIHHLWTDSKRCAFTWSMPSKIVLHRKKSILVRKSSLLHWQCRNIVFMGFKNLQSVKKYQ